MNPENVDPILRSGTQNLEPIQSLDETAENTAENAIIAKLDHMALKLLALAEGDWIDEDGKVLIDISQKLDIFAKVQAYLGTRRRTKVGDESDKPSAGIEEMKKRASGAPAKPKPAIPEPPKRPVGRPSAAKEHAFKKEQEDWQKKVAAATKNDDSGWQSRLAKVDVTDTAGNATP